MAAGRPKADWADDLARRIIIGAAVTVALEKQGEKKSLMLAYDTAAASPTLAGYNLSPDTVRREYEAARSGRDARIDREKRTAKYERRKAALGKN